MTFLYKVLCYSDLMINNWIEQEQRNAMAVPTLPQLSQCVSHLVLFTRLKGADGRRIKQSNQTQNILGCDKMRVD
jgi:hypothetical protein